MRYFSADFETCDISKNSDDGVRVWLWGLMDLYDDTDQVIYGTHMNNFIETLSQISKKEEITLYFHNLKFDGVFILDYFLRGLKLKLSSNLKLQQKEFNTLITDVGEFYSIKTILSKRKINIVDSLKLLPLPLEKIGDIFNIPKLVGTIDYEQIRLPNHIPTKTELAYLTNDLLIVKKFVRYLFLDKNLKKMTLSSNAYNVLKKDVENVTDRLFTWTYPEIDEIEYTQLKKSYKGGICQVNREAKQDVSGCSFDNNSLYPAQMLLKPLPYDKPIYIGDVFTCKTSKYNFENIPKLAHSELTKMPLYIQSANCKYTVKKEGIPCIFSDGKINGFDLATPLHETSREIVATMVDWWHIFKNYDVEIVKYNFAYGFKKSNKECTEKSSHFYEFINRNRQGKIESEIAGKNVERLFFKTFQNASYGKFGSTDIGDLKEPYIDVYEKINYITKKESKATEYLPVAIFVTSWGRDELLTTIYKVGFENFNYCDTDSIHCLLTKEEFENRVSNVHNTKYGCWKYEYTFTRGKYLKAKTYAEETVEKGLVIKCASMHHTLKSKIKYEDFFIGNSWKNGNLKSYTVKGGKRLVFMDFKIQ